MQRIAKCVLKLDGPVTKQIRLLVFLTTAKIVCEGQAVAARDAADTMSAIPPSN